VTKLLLSLVGRSRACTVHRALPPF